MGLGLFLSSSIAIGLPPNCSNFFPPFICCGPQLLVGESVLNVGEKKQTLLRYEVVISSTLMGAKHCGCQPQQVPHWTHPSTSHIAGHPAICISPDKNRNMYMGRTLTSSVHWASVWCLEHENCHQMIVAEASCLLDLSRRNDSSSLITGGIFHVP